ncbi:MAG: hypothetical protein CBD49_01070 [Acidimicrobiaceae bacterium TMED189]|nr:MAG: hypothetical protein CBD49_01070 [Acidimicrobiaceae bacterium TMED189]
MAGNTSFDEILTTTLNNYVPRLTDNIFSARPLFYALTNGQTMRTVSGGAKIVVPIIYKANDTAKSYAGTETIDITAQTGITAAEYSWGQYASTVTINGLEEAQNNGEAQIIDLLEGKIFQTQESIIENMNTMFHGDGTTKATDWNGLENIVNDSALTANTLGGIDPSATGNAFWKSQATTTTGALTLAKLATRYNSVSVGNDQPTIIISKADDYESYEALLTSNIRYTDTDMADAGFQNLMYKGAPWTFDAATTDGVVYMLNTKYLQLVRHSDTWFKPTPFVRPNDKDAVYSQILCYGQLTCSNRDRQGYLEGVT